MNSSPKISIVIPTLDDLFQLQILLNKLPSQILLPYEIIVIDSSSNNEIQNFLSDLNYPIKIHYSRIGRAYRWDRFLSLFLKIIGSLAQQKKLSNGRAYPYEASNKGAKLASGNWLAFLDSTTLPKNNWLYDYSKQLIDDNLEAVFGSTKYYAETYFQKVFRAATWGVFAHETMPGTLIKRELYFPIKEGVRAGGDVEWRKKVKSKLRWATPKTHYIKYKNIPKNILNSSKKMFIYQLHAARVDIQHPIKDAYLGIFLLLSIFIIPKWNSLVGWESSPFFIPNITKVYFISIAATLLAILLVNRGLLRGVEKNNFFIYVLKIFFLIFSIIFVYNWNEDIAGWVEESIWFIPHITKIFITFVFLCALSYRGLYFPMQNGIKSSFLFPVNFLVVGLIGILNDVLKAPGYLCGAILSSFIRK